MKKVIMLVMVFVFSLVSISFADGIGVYSEGYKMGQLTKFSVKGLIFKSGEGELLLGVDSTPYALEEVDNKGNKIVTEVNPWYFSSINTKMHEKINSNLGEYVAIKYKQSHIKNPDVDTDYEVIDVVNISRDKNYTAGPCKAEKFVSGMKSSGVRAGRIVKASSKGIGFKSYEILIQQGNSGNQFMSMSISADEKLYECATKYLLAGRQVKITYSESFLNLSMLSRDTNYDIVKIEPVHGFDQ